MHVHILCRRKICLGEKYVQVHISCRWKMCAGGKHAHVPRSNWFQSTCRQQNVVKAQFYDTTQIRAKQVQMRVRNQTGGLNAGMQNTCRCKICSGEQCVHVENVCRCIYCASEKCMHVHILCGCKICAGEKCVQAENAYIKGPPASGMNYLTFAPLYLCLLFVCTIKRRCTQDQKVA